MSKQTRINIALVAIIAVLLIVSTGLEKDEQNASTRISDIDVNSITRISVTRKGKPDLVFNKQVDGWQMQSPLQIRVNISRVNAMLRLLNAESFNQLNPDEVDLDQLELDTPKVELRLDDYVFQFGNTDAIDQRRYVLFDNNIYMVNDFLYAQLGTKPGFFADTRLLAEGKSINTIAFPENTFRLIDGMWQMETVMDIKTDQIKRLAYSWENAIAISVSDYQQPQQEFPISITTMDNASLIFNIVNTEPHLVLGRKDLGIQYHMGSDEAQKLLLQENPPADSVLDETATN